jgi:hypothetical protein
MDTTCNAADEMAHLFSALCAFDTATTPTPPQLSEDQLTIDSTRHIPVVPPAATAADQKVKVVLTLA